jgi:hypothetical protein
VGIIDSPVERTMKISGTVAIVTGASRGIGRCLAAHLARRGATIALVARESRALEDAATIAREVSPGSLAITTDITSQAAVGSMVRTVLDHFGRVDILVNNAGRGAYGPFLDLAPQILAEVMAVNFWGTVNCIQAVLPGMIARRSGHIVNLGAIDGKFAVAGDSVGASTKFAVVGLSEALRLELEPVGVRVTLVNPGAVDTESFRTDLRRRR